MDDRDDGEDASPHFVDPRLVQHHRVQLGLS